MVDYNLIKITDLPSTLGVTFNGNFVPISNGTATQKLELELLRSAILNSPTLTGAALSTTPNPDDNSQRIATTAYVQTELSSLGLNPATSTSFGTIRTNTTTAVPIVYLKSEVDALQAQVRPVSLGGTGASTPDTARTNLVAAKSGVNSDITVLNSLNTTPSVVLSTINAILPVGTIILSAATSAPSGYLLCDGQPVSRTTYSALFNAIGIIYGPGDEINTFNVPNLCGRVPMGSGTSPASGVTRPTGTLGGTETHTLSVAEMPSHDHTDRHLGVIGSGVAGYGGNVGTLSAGLKTFATGGGQPHNNLQPYIVLNYYIRF